MIIVAIKIMAALLVMVFALPGTETLFYSEKKVAKSKPTQHYSPANNLALSC
ncbi:MAG: hypothetical protein IPP29_05680 [Bacteroidetes bacterium]|nr:hypothetical protein [Bacteroidota bacterium]